MKKAVAVFLTVILSANLMFFTVGCEQKTADGSMNIPKPEREVLESFDLEISNVSNEFGLKILQKLTEKEENIFISPTSIYTALAMTYNGAGSDTQKAMAEVLGIKDVDLKRFNENNLALLYFLQEADPEVTINIANSLWLRENVKFDEDFVTRNEKYYQAVTEELDFSEKEAVDTINQWVNNRTNGLIEDIVEYPIDPLTIMFLINAVYFQGDWTEPFDPEDTTKDSFYAPKGEIPEVSFMHRSDDMKYLEKEGEFQAVRIPYGKEERLAMYVFLPDEESSLKKFLENLSIDKWKDWKQKFSKVEGDLFLPSFKMEYEKPLNEILKAMGMEIAFNDKKADFFEMVPRNEGPRIFISEVKHKSFIEVDEKGTKAAAATSVEMTVESVPMDKFNMKVDRPFYFHIHDKKTNEILFTGTVANPTE